MNFSEDIALTLAFYHGPLTSMKAEARLRAKGPGHYLLRLSSLDVGEYVLSVINSKDQLRHLSVPKSKRSDLIAKHPNLTTLAEVVNFIISSCIERDGQSLFQFQLNVGEADHDDEDNMDMEMNYDALTCHVCHDNLDTSAKYKNHMETHRLVYCELCGMCLLKGSHTGHKKTCSAKNAFVTYECELCNFSTQYKQVLTAHRKKHQEGNLPYICEVDDCRNAFKTLKALDKGSFQK